MSIRYGASHEVGRSVRPMVSRACSHEPCKAFAVSGLPSRPTKMSAFRSQRHRGALCQVLPEERDHSTAHQITQSDDDWQDRALAQDPAPRVRQRARVHVAQGPADSTRRVGARLQFRTAPSRTRDGHTQRTIHSTNLRHQLSPYGTSPFLAAKGSQVESRCHSYST
jgi:hypothetical protein